MRKFVDTNIFLRFLLADHPQQSPACKKLFEKATKNQIELVTLPIVIVEISWVLLSFYKETKKEAVKKIKTILFWENLEILDRDILLSAVDLFEKNNLDFIDAYVASWLEAKKIKQVYSYDHDFDKLGNVSRIEP